MLMIPNWSIQSLELIKTQAFFRGLGKIILRLVRLFYSFLRKIKCNDTLEEEKQTYFSSTTDYYEAMAMKTGRYSQMKDET